MCHYLELKQNPEEEEDEEDNQDGSDETSEPVRAGGLNLNCTFFLDEIGIHLNPPHGQAVLAEKVY